MEHEAFGGLTSVLEAPPTPQWRRVGNVDLREEFAAATAAIKDQKWVKALTQRVARLGDESDPDESESPTTDDRTPQLEHLPPPGKEGMTVPTSEAVHPHPQVPSAVSVLVPPATDDVLATLDPRFFTESFDACAYVLTNLPLTRVEIDDFLQTEISAVDLTKDLIVSKLADDVRSNHDAFIQGMKLVQDVDLDLVRAQIHVKNARRLITSTKQDLVKGSLEIVKTKRNRDRVLSIIDLGSRIVRCFEEEERMNSALQSHAFTTAVDICLALRSELGASDLQGISILRKLSHRVQNFLPELRSQFDKSLRHVAEHFDPLEYKELLQAYITLADHAENLGFEFSARHLRDVLSSIPEIIVRCIDELSRQHLVELFGERGSPKKHKASNSGKDSRGEGMKFSAPSIADTIDKVLRAYECLTDLMHTYYLLVQWHRDPFNPSNDDLVYLHRCGIDDDDDDDEDDDGDGDADENDTHSFEEKGVLSPSGSLRKSFLSPKRRRGSSISSEPQSSQRSPYDQVLCETGMTLLRYRKIVWETMQQNISEVFERLDAAYGLKLEHIITLSQTTLAFIDVGEEFIGSPSTKLRSILRLKCEQYIASFQDDNLELLRMLIDTENWQRILSSTSTVNDFKGMLRLVEKRSGYLFDDPTMQMSSSINQRPIYERTVFPSFLSTGNPFAVSNTSRWFKLTSVQATNENSRQDVSDAAMTDLSSDENNNQCEDLGGDDSRGQADTINEDFVLTSSSLSGFVRMCGIYLKMMHCLPHISWDIFLHLVKLFEFNLYAVFVSFVEPHYAQLLFHGLLPENDAWDVLRSSIARISRDFNSGEIMLRTYVVPSRHSQADNDIITLRHVTRVPVAMDQASETNTYAFSERAVAAGSAVSQKLLLRALKPLISSHIPDRYQPLMEEVYTRCEESAIQLRRFLFASFASAALSSDPTMSIPYLMSQVKWSEVSFVSDRHSDYIVHIVRKCGEVWGGMQIYSDGAIPIGAKEDAWDALVQQVMDSMLAGVASILKCTTHGRALMAMDLLALQNGLDLINHVSNQRVRRGFLHVNSYIKAFFLDESELLQWVRNNKSSYSKASVASLIRHGVGSAMTKSELREFVLRIDAILSEP